MRIVRTLTSLAILGVLLAAALNGGRGLAQEPLRWKFKPGETLNYVLERGVEGKMNLSGSEIAFKMGMAFDISWTPKTVAADGTAVVDLKIERMQVSMASPLGGNLAYDSASNEKPSGIAWAQVEPMATGLLGQTLQATISPLGQVSDIKLPEKLVEVFAKQQQSPNRQAGFGIGGNALSERGIKELIEKSVLPLPENASDKSATWKQHFENPIPRAGTQMLDTVFSVAGSEQQDGKQLAKIAAVTEITFEPEENPQADVEIMSQEGLATFYFDAQAGRMVKAGGKLAFVLEMTGARDITQDMKETMSMRLGKSDPPAAKPAAK